MTRDRARSYEPIDDDDLDRLGRLASVEVDQFFIRNPHRSMWRDRLCLVALAQGGAEHYLRGERGVWDFDLMLFFAQHPDDKPRPYLRRSPRRWDWGPSRFGRCPYDPSGYSGRAVDVMLWVIPDRRDPVEGLTEWLASRRSTKPNPITSPDLAHEPVVLVAPERGRVVWDPPGVPPPKMKTEGHRPPSGVAPP